MRPRFQIRGEWHGRLAEQWGLRGEVREEHFQRLSEGQQPITGEQLVRHQEGPLTLLVARALREIELGRPRAEALEEMAQATGVEDFVALVRSIIHAERTGVPIARTIAAHSAQMRVKRRLRIRADAARASLKILLPTVGCVFPTLWLILLGPALLVVLAIKH